MLEAKAGLASQLEAFAVNTAEFMTRERTLLLDGVGIPDDQDQASPAGTSLVVVRGHDTRRT